MLAQLAGVETVRNGDRDRAIGWALRAWGDGELLTMTTADDPCLPAITMALSEGDALEDCLTVSSAMIDDARRRGSAPAFAASSYLRGTTHLFAGDLPAAVADLESATDERHGWEAYLPSAVGHLARALIARGQLDRAHELVHPPAAKAGRWSRTPVWGRLLEARGWVELARGHAAAALEAFNRTAAAAELLGFVNPHALRWRSGRALALAALGRTDEALQQIDDELDGLRAWGAPSGIGSGLRIRGLVASDGTADFEAAADVLDGSVARLELARALCDLGRAQLAAGETAAGQDSLRRALDAADSCGATAVSGAARAALVASGARPRRPRTTGPDSLTPGERRVAEQAAAGLSNRDIAEALFVTRKAVEWHLGNAYRKLGISSRSALPSALRPDGQGARSRP